MNNIPHNNPRIPEAVGAGSYLSAILAGVLVAEIVIVSLIAYNRVTAALDPEKMANRVEAAIRENYPQFREELVQKVHNQSPAIAARVSRSVTASAPEARQWLEDFTAQQLTVGLNEAGDLSAEQFRTVLRDNRETVIQAFEQIEAAPDETRRLVLEMETEIENQLGVDIRKQAESALAVHIRLNDKLARLNDADATLEPQELLERRMVRILKTMQDAPE
ncbi:hypothetical protein ETAA8_37700 [Anatilimnocola aggregata]|uniref:Uncharacterized protein n=1 Tax=Anatilimnocola aggregata TaxID=2528021 RepID=A0A517YEM0_9BACT|nr:hypothetical protein [Anatilimnocola aggregata]QDU28667.1 hypothetical protein ETAA8_37700 [Anatilimnocola aggregata]